MSLKRGEQIPSDTNPAVKEFAQAFTRNWCLKAIEKSKNKEAKTKATDTVEAFSWRWYKEIVEPANSNPRNIQRLLEKEVILAIGTKIVVLIKWHYRHAMC